MNKTILIVVILIILQPVGLLSQVAFTESTTHNLDAHFQGSMVTDGQSILCSGFTSFTTSSITAATSFYSNDGSGVFTHVTKPFINVHNGFALYYDGTNGKNFVVVGGTTFSATPFNPEGKIYIDNGSGGYTTQTIIGLFQAIGILVDLDNDGDLDLWTEGIDENSDARKVIYRNDNDLFVEVLNTTTGARYSGSLSAADTDNDGDLDVLRSGQNTSSIDTDFYRNDGSFVFTSITNTISDVSLSSHIFVDINNDGNLDIIISGSEGSTDFIFKVYIGDGNNNFTFSLSYTGMYSSSIKSDDVDNDGDQDFYINGKLLGGIKGTYLYLNDGSGNFSQDESFNPGVHEGMIVVFNVDNQGYNDFVFMGDIFSPPFSDPVAKVYLNDFGVDAEDPNAVCQNITVELDTNGNVSIIGTDVDGGSTDNVGIVSYTVSPNIFNCGNIGANSVTLTVEDAAGNTDICTATITVVDDIPPVTVGHNITINLNGNTSISITADDIDNGSTDNCNFSQTLSMDTFTAIGIYNVDLTSTDDSSNSDTETYQVTVINTLGIDDFTKVSFKIAPNPVGAVIHFEVSSQFQVKSVTIIDITGRLLIQEGDIRDINVQHLPSGTYFVKVVSNKGSISKRIIKQ